MTDEDAKARSAARSMAYRERKRTAGASVSKAVSDAIEKAQIEPRDVGAVALAKRYAALIDDAAPAAKYRPHLRALEAAALGDEDAEQALDKITDALAAHTVASDLGPKLLAALTALGMTVAGRAAKGGGQGASPVASKLDEFTARRAGRNGS